MTTLRASRELWHPVTETDRQVVLQELHNLLESPQFCNSKRYPVFLRYVVQSALDGHAHLLKERTIGIEVFGRPADYDTNADTIVRFTAGEVRKRLALYYHEHEASSAVQIGLPTGSYAPEFLHAEEDSGRASAVQLVTSGPLELIPQPPPIAEPAAHPERPAQISPIIAARRTWWSGRPARLLLGLALLALIAVALAFSRHYAETQNDVDRYWAPLFAEKNPILLGVGATVLAPQHYPGPTTADKTTDYPFVSMQMVTAIVRVTGILDRRGAPYEMRSAPFLTLTDLRERPTVLVGAYNNEWTMRFVSPLRFYFAPGDPEAILDREHPGVSWHRDATLPYAKADDFALVGRFRDPTTDSLIFIVAGIGRNGTEAAAQFVTTPRYIESLKQQAGPDWANKNIEAVIKTHVIEGRTGAPSVVAVHVW